jgi:hypothetical protein
MVLLDGLCAVAAGAVMAAAAAAEQGALKKKIK